MKGNDNRLTDGCGKLYYDVYIPKPLPDIAELELDKKIEKAEKHLYYLIGYLAGKSATDKDVNTINTLIFRQEASAYLKTDKKKLDLLQVYGIDTNKDLDEILKIFKILEQKNQELLWNDILTGKIQYQEGKEHFRKQQILEIDTIALTGMYEFNPASPDRIAELMKALRQFVESKMQENPLLCTALMCYQFLTILPYADKNIIWCGILVNSYLVQCGFGCSYFIPVMKRMLEREGERKLCMSRVRQSGDYGYWITFFYSVLEDSLQWEKTFIDTSFSLFAEAKEKVRGKKKEVLLLEIIDKMRATPIIDIKTVADYCGVAYNTAAKAIGMLVVEGTVSEMSKKQRYRVYCYEKYLKELMK